MEAAEKGGHTAKKASNIKAKRKKNLQVKKKTHPTKTRAIKFAVTLDCQIPPKEKGRLVIDVHGQQGKEKILGAVPWRMKKKQC